MALLERFFSLAQDVALPKIFKTDVGLTSMQQQQIIVGSLGLKFGTKTLEKH